MKKLLFPSTVLVALLPFAHLAYLWPSVPQTVPVHFDLRFQPDRFGPKSELWLLTAILCAISLLAFLLLTNLKRVDPKRYAKGTPADLRPLAFGTVVFLATISCVLTTASAKGSFVLQTALFPLLGAFLAFLGHSFRNIRPNYFAGFRLPWTLNNDENWRRTHHLAGRVWMVGGLAVALICFLLPPAAAFVFFIAAVLVLTAVPVVYSFRLFKQGC